MERIKIIADDKIPFLKGVLEPYADISYLPPYKIAPDAVKPANALIIRTRTLCNESLLKGSNVKMIATATIGYDHIDRNYCAKAGITWSNAPGCNADSVAQYVLSTIFLWARKRNKMVKGLKLGLVGVGNVGKSVAAFAARFGMEVLLCDPPRALAEVDDSFMNVEELAQKADIISFHTPLIFDTDFSTFKLCNSELMELMKGREVLIINSARGGVIDEKALLAFIKDNDMCDVALDCWENEPHINMDLLNTVMLATPHIAGYSYDGKANATRMAVNSVSGFFSLGVDTSAIQPPAPADPVISIGNILVEMVNRNIIDENMMTEMKDGLGYAGSLDDILKAVDLPLHQREYLMGEILLRTYNPVNDTKRLRNDPGSFEEQRGDYPFRRELKAYTIQY